jgi:hypothetical protein
VVAGLTELDDVSFDDAPITDADLAHFKGHTRMKKMYLHGTALTDEALAHLRGMRELVHLGVPRTAITEKGARALADALPSCRIEWSGGVIDPAKK